MATFSRRCSATSNFTSNICWLRFNHYILFLHILPRVSDHYIFLTFSRRYSYFFRNENMKNICENFTSNICWLRLKIIFFMKMNSNIFANFTSNICSLLRHFCKFYLEYLIITAYFWIFYLEYLLISVKRFYVTPNCAYNLTATIRSKK